MVPRSESGETTSLLSESEERKLLIATLNELTSKLTISTFSTAATREQARKEIKDVLSNYLDNGAVVSNETDDSVHSAPSEKPSPEKNLNEIIVILDKLKQRKEIELLLIDVVKEKFNEALSSLLPVVSSSEAVSKIITTNSDIIITLDALSNAAVQEAYGNNHQVKNAVKETVKETVTSSGDTEKEVTIAILDNITGPEATTLGTLPSKIANPYRTMMGDLYLSSLDPSKLKDPKPNTDQALIMYFMEKAKADPTEALAKQINSAFPLAFKANATTDTIDQRLADIIKNNLPISSKLPSGQLSPRFAEAILDYVSTKITDENRQSFLKITTNSAFKDYCKDTIKSGFGAILKTEESETPSAEEINKQIIPALKCYNPKEIGDIPLDPAPDLKTLLTTYGHLKIGSSDTAPSLTRLYADSVVSQQDKIQENLAALVDICIQQTTATITLDDPKLTAKQTNSPPITTLLDKSKDGKCIADLVFAKGNLDTKTTLQNALTKQLKDLLEKKSPEERDEKHIKTICELAAAPANKFTDQNKQEIYKAFIEQKRYSDARTFLTSLPKLSIDKEFEYLREAQKLLQSQITAEIGKKLPTSDFDEYIKERKEAQNSKIGYMKSLMSSTTDLKTMTDEYLSIEKRLNEIRLKAVDNKQLLANISEREYRDKLHEEMIKALESNFTGSTVSRTPDPKNPNKFEFCIAKTSSSGAGLASGAAQSSTLIAEVKPGLPRSIEFDFSKVAEADKKDATAAACEAIGNMKFQKIEIEGTIDSEEKLERVKALLQNLRKNYTADQLDLTNLKIAAPINSSKQEDPLVSAISNNQITNYLATLQEKAQPPKI